MLEEQQNTDLNKFMSFTSLNDVTRKLISDCLTKDANERPDWHKVSEMPFMQHSFEHKWTATLNTDLNDLEESKDGNLTTYIGQEQYPSTPFKIHEYQASFSEEPDDYKSIHGYP